MSDAAGICQTDVQVSGNLGLRKQATRLSGVCLGNRVSIGFIGFRV